jgi:hypothetical protein
MTMFSAARMTVRVVGLAMLILGLVIWTGSADGLVPVHMLLGIVLVLALWTVAVLAVQAGTRPVLPAIAIAWGVLVAGFGMTQAQILPDDSLHVVIRGRPSRRRPRGHRPRRSARRGRHPVGRAGDALSDGLRRRASDAARRRLPRRIGVTGAGGAAPRTSARAIR